MTQVNEVLWKLTPDDTKLMTNLPVKGENYFVDIPHEFPGLELQTDDLCWLAYNLQNYFVEGYSFPGNIDTEELFYVKVLKVDNEKHIAEVNVLEVMTLAAYVDTLPFQKEPDGYIEGEIGCMGRRMKIAKYRDHYFFGSNAFGNTYMAVTTTFHEGIYVTMISECICNALPVLKLGKFELPESIKAIITEAEINQSEKFRKFSSKHDDYSRYTEQHGNVIHVMIPNPNDDE